MLDRTAAAILAAMTTASVTAQVVALDIACTGTESGGGGLTRYMYDVRNPTPNPVTLSFFAVGTDDLNALNYSGWVTPNPAIWATGVVVGDGRWTTGVKTPHGIIPPFPLPGVTSGSVWFWDTTGVGVTLAPNATTTFGFNNPNPSEDVDWAAEHPRGTLWGHGFPAQPIAGPLGVFTQGFVHAPVPEVSWYAVASGFGLLGFGLYRRMT